MPISTTEAAVTQKRQYCSILGIDDYEWDLFGVGVDESEWVYDDKSGRTFLPPVIHWWKDGVRYSAAVPVQTKTRTTKVWPLVWEDTVEDVESMSDAAFEIIRDWANTK